MAPLKYLSNFWKTLQLLLINCEIKLTQANQANQAANQATACAITDTRLYVPVVTLSTDDNPKLLQQLNLGFKRTVNWNKLQIKAPIQIRNQYLDCLTDPSFM